jgi:hypothetical protein
MGEWAVRWFAGLCLAASAPAWAAAGPPLITDDPETVGAGNGEINLAIVTELAPDHSRLQTPIGDFNYGVGDRIQLKYEVPWVEQQVGGGPTVSGLAASLVGVRYRFADKQTSGVAVSAYPQFSFLGPGSSALDPDIRDPQRRSLFLPIEAEENAGVFELNQEVGLNIVWRDIAQWVYGVALTYPLREGWILLGEIHGIVQSDLSDSQAVFNLGTSLDLNQRFTLLLSAGHSIVSARAAAPIFISYTGIQLHL